MPFQKRNEKDSSTNNIEARKFQKTLMLYARITESISDEYRELMK